MKHQKCIQTPVERTFPLKKTKTQSSGKDSSDFDSHESEVTPPVESEHSAEEQVRQEIRLELVEKFKSSLQQGNYKIKSPEIAEKMVQKIRENKHAP